MPRKCTVCTHQDREAIDRALIVGEPFRRIATQFSLSEASVRRHKADHLPAELVQAKDALDVARADDLLAQVRQLRDKSLAILARAERANDLRTALQAVREARGNLELLAKLLGELDQQPQVNVLVASPAWLGVRAAILHALAPFPDARGAVVQALENVSP